MAQKITATHQKKFGQGLEDFAPIFGKLNTPYTSHSAYVATETELVIAKIDGSL